MYHRGIRRIRNALIYHPKKYQVANYCPKGSPRPLDPKSGVFITQPHTMRYVMAYLHDFLWHMWVDIQPVVSVVLTSVIFFGTCGWMSSQWSVWYIPPGFLWHVWVVV